MMHMMSFPSSLFLVIINMLFQLEKCLTILFPKGALTIVQMKLKQITFFFVVLGSLAVLYNAGQFCIDFFLNKLVFYLGLTLY